MRKLANMLKPLTVNCKEGKCGHKKCKCGHCSLYHISRVDKCCKVNNNLTTCLCKIFEAIK